MSFYLSLSHGPRPSFSLNKSDGPFHQLLSSSLIVWRICGLICSHIWSSSSFLYPAYASFIHQRPRIARAWETSLAISSSVCGDTNIHNIAIVVIVILISSILFAFFQILIYPYIHMNMYVYIYIYICVCVFD